MGIDVDEEPEEQPLQMALAADYDDDLIVEGEVLDDDQDDGSAAFCGPQGQPWGDEPNPFGPSGPPRDHGIMPWRRKPKCGSTPRCGPSSVRYHAGVHSRQVSNLPVSVS